MITKEKCATCKFYEFFPEDPRMGLCRFKQLPNGRFEEVVHVDVCNNYSEGYYDRTSS